MTMGGAAGPRRRWASATSVMRANYRLPQKLSFWPFWVLATQTGFLDDSRGYMEFYSYQGKTVSEGSLSPLEWGVGSW